MHQPALGSFGVVVVVVVVPAQHGVGSRRDGLRSPRANPFLGVACVLADGPAPSLWAQELFCEHASKDVGRVPLLTTSTASLDSSEIGLDAPPSHANRRTYKTSQAVQHTTKERNRWHIVTAIATSKLSQGSGTVNEQEIRAPPPQTSWARRRSFSPERRLSWLRLARATWATQLRL